MFCFGKFTSRYPFLKQATGAARLQIPSTVFNNCISNFYFSTCELSKYSYCHAKYWLCVYFEVTMARNIRELSNTFWFFWVARDAIKQLERSEKYLIMTPALARNELFWEQIDYNSVLHLLSSNSFPAKWYHISLPRWYVYALKSRIT